MRGTIRIKSFCIKSFCVMQISFFLLLVGVADAQTPLLENGYWNWTEASTHHNAVVQVKTDTGAGSGVLVHIFRSRPIGKGHEGLVLTAHHVVSDGQNIKVAYQNGKKAKDCTIVSVNEEVDIAFLRVWVPEGAKEVPLAKQRSRPGDMLEFCGYGGNASLDQLRHFEAMSESPTNTKQIFASVPLLSGDSGGPVFNAKHEVAGVISGGWFWFDGETSKNGARQILTWPARSSNLNPILDLASELKSLLPEDAKSNRP